VVCCPSRPSAICIQDICVPGLGVLAWALAGCMSIRYDGNAVERATCTRCRDSGAAAGEQQPVQVPPGESWEFFFIGLNLDLKKRRSCVHSREMA
jgi:hypothetical protein